MGRAAQVDSAHPVHDSLVRFVKGKVAGPLFGLVVVVEPLQMRREMCNGLPNDGYLAEVATSRTRDVLPETVHHVA